MRRALITGMQGFTGGYVAAELERHGWEVWGIGFRENTNRLRYKCVDLLDLGALCAVIHELQPEAVVHLAAIAFVEHGDADALYKVNLLGTRNLLAALTTASPKCVLLASSANIYGNSTLEVLSETSPPTPANDYAVSKLAMEHM